MSRPLASPRKLAALRAMAAQQDSPREREIAVAKLSAAVQEESELDGDWRALWANQQEHQRIADRVASAARDAEIAAIVRRWERGTFSGLRVAVGSERPAIEYDGKTSA